METNELHPMVGQSLERVRNKIAAEKSGAPPVQLTREPVLNTPEDAPKEKGIKLTTSDDYLPYLAQLEDEYDLQEQAFQSHREGKAPPPNVVSNKYLKPLKKTVMGIDVATGQRVLNRGDFNNEESARHYHQGAARFREASLNINEGYDVTGVSAAAHMAAGVIEEGKTKKEYMRSIDMMNVPEWQASAAWDSAVANKAQGNVDKVFSRPYTDEEMQDLEPEPPADMSREELAQDEGWQKSAAYIYESEEAEPFTGTPEELMDWFVDEMTSFNWRTLPGVNTSSMSYYAVRAYNQGDEYAKNFLSMMDYYDRLETDLGIVAEATGAALTDPLNFIGLGGGLMAKTIMGRIAKDRLKRWMRYSMSGAIAGTFEGAAMGGADSAMRQSIAISAGEQESIDKGQVAGQAALAAVLGGKFGGAIATGLSPVAINAYRRGAKQMMRNARRGGSYTPITRQAGQIGIKPESRYVVPEEMTAAPTLENSAEIARQGKFKTNRDLKLAFQETMKLAARRAGVNLNNDTEKSNEILTSLMLQDARSSIASNANAIGWYDRTVGAAMEVLSLIHPEIKTDEQAKFAFTFALANTSNGLKVNKNFELAEKAYNVWKNTGRMPDDIGIGNASDAINKTMTLFNTLSDSIGIDAMGKLFDDTFTVGQLARLGFDVSGENIDTLVRGAAMMGPKIGNGFFANLRGHFDQLTMDRWFVRTWGRLTANLIENRPDMVREKTAALKALVEPIKKDDDIVNAWKDIGVNLRERSMKKLSAQIQKSSMKPENREVMNASGNEFSYFPKRTKQKKPSVQGDEVRKTGNSLQNYIDGQKEDPANGNERNRMRLILQNVKDELTEQYPDMTMSDLQAVLWYAEKRLYDKAKNVSDIADGYVDDEAPDYANAAADLAKKLGFTDEQIKEADTYGRAAGTRSSTREDGGQGVEGGQEADRRRARRKYLSENLYEKQRPRGASDGKASSFKRKSRVSDRRVRGIVKTYEPKATYANLLDASEMVHQPIHEITPERSGDFRQAISSSKSENPFGAAVHVYPESGYRDMRLFLTEDGTGGFAIKEDGDIVSVFSKGGGNVYEMLQLAVEEGGTKLDAFDTVLPEIYERAGFVEYDRAPWDEKQKSEGWDKDVFSEFNNGEPDIVFMRYEK